VIADPANLGYKLLDFLLKACLFMLANQGKLRLEYDRLQIISERGAYGIGTIEIQKSTMGIVPTQVGT
jgi:hypothetical protein